MVFYGQLALGLAGLDAFLMHPGKLHFPIPALIVAGPLFRGERFFMLALFLSTVVLVGPAWCSFICYQGSWDLEAARRTRRPRTLPGPKTALRVAMLLIVVGTTLALRLLGAPLPLAGALALLFGLVGVGLMLLWSRRIGTMAHCALYCPVGLLATWLGKLSPFRVRIGAGCDACGRCTLACRYDALRLDDVRAGRVGAGCTLCGDCMASCPGAQLGYRFPGLSSARARALFVVLVVALHAAALGLARV
jgi:polyferredoxin